MSVGDEGNEFICVKFDAKMDDEFNPKTFGDKGKENIIPKVKK